MFSGQVLVQRARPRFAKTLGHLTDGDDSRGKQELQSLLAVQSELVPLRTQAQLTVNRLHGSGQVFVQICRQPRLSLSQFLTSVDSRIVSHLRKNAANTDSCFPARQPVLSLDSGSIRSRNRSHLFQPLINPFPVLSKAATSAIRGLGDWKCLHYDVTRLALPEKRPTVRQSYVRHAIADSGSKNLSDKLISVRKNIEAQNRIANQSEARTMRQEMERMSNEMREIRSLLAAIVATHKSESTDNSVKYQSNWLSDTSVSTDASVLRRVAAIDQSNYVFGQSELEKGSRIHVKVKEVDPNFMESMTFGLTTQEPHLLNVSSLEPFGRRLRRSVNPRHWHLAVDAFADPIVGQEISFKRTAAGVVMKREANEKLLMSISPETPLYPFFLFDGSVRAVEVY